MTSYLLPEGENKKVAGNAVSVPLKNATLEETVSGSPRQGTAELGTLGETEVGIWELRDGVTIDTEVDEFFVVLGGSAKIEFLDEKGEATETVTVETGDVMRLVAGAKTRWTVADFIRKVYIA